MRRSISRILAALFAVLVVSTAAAPVGIAAADHEGIAADCTNAEKLAIGLTLGLVGSDCLMQDHVDTEEVNQTEIEETKTQIRGSASTVTTQSDVFQQSKDNNLNGSRMVARSEAMAEVWDAVQNGSSEVEAHMLANQAIEDYYTTQYRQVANQWNIAALSWVSYNSAEESSDLNKNYVRMVGGGVPGGGTDHVDHVGNGTLTAPNGDAVNVTRIGYAGGDVISPVDITAASLAAGGNYSFTPPFQDTIGPNVTDFMEQFNRIDQQAAETKQNVETVINNTYQPALDGELNMSEYLSANTIAREYASEGDDQAWAAVRLSQTRDVGLPDDLENIGNTTVLNHGQKISGVFLSKSNPTDGRFSVGETYNATTLDGQQIVVQQSGDFHELTGQFTINSVEAADGTERTNLTVRNPEYSATNVSEWKDLRQNLTRMQANLNARQQKLLNQSSGGDGGGGLLEGADDLLPGLNGPQTALLFLLIAAAILLYAGREQSGTNIIERRS